MPSPALTHRPVNAPCRARPPSRSARPACVLRPRQMCHGYSTVTDCEYVNAIMPTATAEIPVSRAPFPTTSRPCETESVQSVHLYWLLSLLWLVRQWPIRLFHHNQHNGPILESTGVAPRGGQRPSCWIGQFNGYLYQRLADALRAAIARGDLRWVPHSQAERQLAEHLLMSRSTVVATFPMLSSQELVSGARAESARVGTVRRNHAARQPRRGLGRSLSAMHAPRRITDAGAGSDRPGRPVDSGGLP